MLIGRVESTTYFTLLSDFYHQTNLIAHFFLKMDDKDIDYLRNFRSLK